MTQRELTIEDLVRILNEVAGEDESIGAPADIVDSSLRELGYDSLAMMEAAARIQQEYGVRVPDEVVMELETPRALLDTVNGLVPVPAGDGGHAGDRRG